MKLEKFNYSSGKRSRWFLYGVICTVALMVLINLFVSQAKYLNAESFKIAEGIINYKPYDFKIMAMYQENENSEYEAIDNMPTSGYVINEEKSYCTIDNINKDSDAVLKTNENGDHLFKGLSKNDKCYLYFDISTAKGIILANKAINTRTDFSTTLTTDTTGTIYSAEDDDGTSYYFAGNPIDNWVKFGGFYWRIIRINGDGTIRIIYQGTAANTTGTGTQIGTSAFNPSSNNNMFAGFMYTSGEVHGLGTNSTIKGVLDTWYNNNLTSYVTKIDTNAGFCNDRQPSTNNSLSNGLGGAGTTTTYYGAYIRFMREGSGTNPQVPTLKCQNSSDLFTVSSSNKGNKALLNPIGLITADEISYAGGVHGTKNLTYYLYTGQVYWSMSPCRFDGVNANAYRVDSDGKLYTQDVYFSYGVRPVINLRADVILTGDGTASNPYVVS